MDEPDFDDLDDLTRAQLAELAHLPFADLASALDEWLSRAHGVHSSHHGVGLFLDLLAERGLSVTRDDMPAVVETMAVTREQAERHARRTGHTVTHGESGWDCVECGQWWESDDPE